MISAKDLSVINVPPAAAEKWTPYLNMAMLKYDIDTPQRQAMFLAQIAHESANFRATVENFNYSAEGLRKTFGKYFDETSAQEYARDPERIANRAYANRMGNGDEASGDGWRFRGRGLIQLTGRTNYALYSLQNANNALIEPESVGRIELASDSAGWFWSTNRLNQLSDTGDIRVVTRRVNGGFNGLDDRQVKYERLLDVLS
jgi:putative chitinase